ncbi:hypothetical protein OEZ86_005805 [Tetradesmus obliquus]|nr:hypothetical protein OEZ86_005805 [Tetradesmus obliquus]
MPPRPFALKIVTDAEHLPKPPPGPNPHSAHPHHPKQDMHDMDSWEVKPDGTCAMLGKSCREYVFSQQGLIKSGGQDAPHYKVSEKDIMFIKALGAGACATVHKGYHHGLRRFVAVKRVNFTNKEMRQQMLRDIKILSEGHDVPGLLSFLGAYLVPEREQIAIVLEYMDGGTLADVLKKLGRLPEDALATITARLLQGLVFMHSRHMVHRDIKPANILMSRSGEAKLSDFGISATAEHTLAQCLTYTGTVTYMSPERLENKPYNFKADIWSLGLVLVECLTGRYPFEAGAAGGPMELIIHVLQDEVPLPPPGAISEPCRDFLSSCLARDPARRPPASALLGHPWLAAAGRVDVRGLMGGLAQQPDERLEEIACQFSFTYYELLGQATQDALDKLAYLYLDHSVLSYQGAVRQGRPAIVAKLQEALQQQQQQQSSSSSAGQGRRVWRVASVDSQQVAGVDCVLVHVMGSIQADSNAAFSSSSGSQSAAARKFSESFILARSASGNYYIANQAFQLLQ